MLSRTYKQADVEHFKAGGLTARLHVLEVVFAVIRPGFFEHGVDASLLEGFLQRTKGLKLFVPFLYFWLRCEQEERGW